MNRHDEIALLAYQLYENSGFKEGRDLSNWLEAERIISATHMIESERLLEWEGIEPFEAESEVKVEKEPVPV
jgi:hypothetical protein